MDILGMTPFYTGEPMDGEILIKETIDNGILSRISKMINEHIEDPSFAATSSLIITFLNITNKRAQKVFL
jgi:hypothetical protein